MATYIGRDGELWVDTVSNLLKISDGATPGGVVVTTDGGAVHYLGQLLLTLIMLPVHQESQLDKAQAKLLKATTQ